MHKISIVSDNVAYHNEVNRFIEEWNNEELHIKAHTSGSTGNPKVILLSKERMRVSARATGRFFGFTPKWHLCSPLPVGFIAGKMMIVRALEWRLSLDILEPSSNPLLAIDKAYDFMVMTPHQLGVGMESESSVNLRYIKRLLLGGSPIKEHLITQLQKIDTAVFMGYGMTETMSHVALRGLNGHDKTSSYTAVENILFTTDERHCLVIHGEKLLEKVLVTNDVVDLQSNTEFTWLGRHDHVINTGGIKVFPEAVEQKIQSLISSPYYISSTEHDTLGEQVILRIEENVWSKEKQAHLLKLIENELTRYELPKKIIFHKSFDYTENRKLIRL